MYIQVMVCSDYVTYKTFKSADSFIHHAYALNCLNF